MESSVIEYELMAEEIVIKAGKKIKEFREKKELTQTQLGQLCRPVMLQQNIQKYETGQRSLSVETLAKIAKALRVDIKELL